MKATDLMVGDYICLDGDVDYDNPIQVQQIGFQGNNDIIADNDVFGVDDIIPIPLTEEILVKNGFERCDYNNKYFIINDVIDLITPKWRGGTEYYACTWYQDEFDDTVQHIEICKCAYVHQLQHLLGMVGVQKKIEL